MTVGFQPALTPSSANNDIQANEDTKLDSANTDQVAEQTTEPLEPNPDVPPGVQTMHSPEEFEALVGELDRNDNGYLNGDDGFTGFGSYVNPHDPNRQALRLEFRDAATFDGADIIAGYYGTTLAGSQVVGYGTPVDLDDMYLYT